MILFVDFDNVVVKQDHDYGDIETPLALMDGARGSLASLKRAGHVLVLWSARSSRCLLVDPMLDPLARAGIKRVDIAQWRKSQPLNIARHRQMLDFVARELPGVFDAISDGAEGKPVCDLFIDDRAIRFGRSRGGDGWWAITEKYGQPELAQPSLRPAAPSARRLLPPGALVVPQVAQVTDYSCGAAALLAVLRFFGVSDATDERALFSALGITPQNGTAPEDIVRVANAHGLVANWRTGVGLPELRAAVRESVPVILDVQDTEGGPVQPGLPDGHYVVLVAIDALVRSSTTEVVMSPSVLRSTQAVVMNPSGGYYETIDAGDLLARWVDTDGKRGGIFVMSARR